MSKLTNSSLGDTQQRNHIPAMTNPEKPAHPQPDSQKPPEMPKEIGGPKGPEPTRYGDWEKNGRCTDF